MRDVQSKKRLAGLLLLWATSWALAQSPMSQWRLGKSATATRYVGAQACAQCHGDLVNRYAASAMAHALAKAEAFPRDLPLAFKLSEYEYKLEREGEQVQYTIARNGETFSAPLLWTFGHGASGHTFVLQHEGKFYESRVSYFTNLQRLDLTPGAPREIPSALAEAIGQPLTNETALACFKCHSTPSAATNAATLQEFTPNVNCEACHGAGERHVALMRSQTKTSKSDLAIFNPAKLPADDLNQQFCGACHRSWLTVMAMPNRGGIANVRFQPYRLANSKCYQNPDDRRISCTACHDPHGALVKDKPAYDVNCLACHKGGVATLKAAAKQRTAPACRDKKLRNCASCHMPAIEPPELHYPFTDHHIRIVKTGEAYPK